VRKTFSVIAILSGMLLTTSAMADPEMPKISFQVIGNHSTNNTYKMGEKPFWEPLNADQKLRYNNGSKELVKMSIECVTDKGAQ